jgi:hypothetical protein
MNTVATNQTDQPLTPAEYAAIDAAGVTVRDLTDTRTRRRGGHGTYDVLLGEGWGADALADSGVTVRDLAGDPASRLGVSPFARDPLSLMLRRGAYVPV